MTDSLISHLPPGEAQYCKQSNGAYNVSIFEPGSVRVLWSVASDMDKSVAAWLAHKLNETARTSEREVLNLGALSGESADAKLR